MECGFNYLLQQSVTLPELPAVVVFKDGGYLTYDGESSTFVWDCFAQLDIDMHNN